MISVTKNKSDIWAIITVLFLWTQCYSLIVLGVDKSLITQVLFYLLLTVVGIASSNILIKKIVAKVDALIVMGWPNIFALHLVNSASLFNYSVFQNFMIRLKLKMKRN
jgi:hypothetical protein